ncbi:hypothetical protein BH23ACI1_BH23ACI1_04090 [soil metagenome]
MTDPLRSDPAADAVELPERDRDARVEELLLSGLDHYFSGQHELAINIWTRVLFLDRGHARARAYIERARSAVSEHQREGEELLHAGLTAFEGGDVEAARRLLTSALERGAAPEEAFALMDRLRRLESARVQAEPRQRRSSGPAPGRRGEGVPASRGDGRIGWIAAGVLLGMASALALMLWAGGDEWFAAGSPPHAAMLPPAADVPLPVPSPSEIALTRARVLFDKGLLREALPALEQIRQGDPLRPQADELRATIQRRLLETRPYNLVRPAAVRPDGGTP